MTVVEPPDPDDLLEMLTNAAEGDTHSEAADSMLQELHGPDETPRTMKTVTLITTALQELRGKIVPLLADKAARCDDRWTLQAWSNWYASSVFDRGTMNAAIDIWKTEMYAMERPEKTTVRMKNAINHCERRLIERYFFRDWEKAKYGHAAMSKL